MCALVASDGQASLRRSISETDLLVSEEEVNQTFACWKEDLVGIAGLCGPVVGELVLVNVRDHCWDTGQCLSEALVAASDESERKTSEAYLKVFARARFALPCAAPRGVRDVCLVCRERVLGDAVGPCGYRLHSAFLVTAPPGTGKTAGVRLLSGHVRETFLECDMREVDDRKLAKLIMEGKGGLRQTSVAILNTDTDVTDELKWRLCKAAQQLQIPLIFVSDDGVVTARDELVRRMTQRNVPEVLELLEQDGEEFCRALQRQYLTSCGEIFETLVQCAFAAMIATLSAETSLPKGRFGQPLDRSQSRGAEDGGLLATNSSPTELANLVVAQDDTDELDRMCEDQDERRRANERRTSNAENEVEGELVRRDDDGKTRLEASTNEECGWTLAEEHENIQDDVTFAEGAWNENAAVFEQKCPVRQRVGLGRRRRCAK